MDPTPILLLAACGGSEPSALEIRFDTEIATVAHVVDDRGQPAGARWGLARNSLDHDITGGLILGAPQGATIWVDSNTSAVVPQTGLPDLQMLRSSPEAAMATGYVAAAILDEEASGIAFYDGQGRVVWGWLAPDDDVSASPVFAESGTDVMAFFSHRNRTIDDAKIRRFAMDGSEITEFAPVRAHHTFVDTEPEPTFLSREFVDIDMAPYGIDESWLVMTDAIRGPGFDFELLDHVDMFWPCGHFDTRFQRFGYTQVHDWSHGNSLVRDGDTWIFGARHHDTIHAIDASGELLWSATIEDSHGHFTEATTDRVLLFDNGAHKDPPHSRVVELAIDQGQVTETWEFLQPDQGFTAWLGDARTLPNGNILMAFTEIGEILEVTRDHQIVWHAKTSGSYVGRIRYTDRLGELPPG